MQKNSTQSINTKDDITSAKGGPKKSTIVFLKQFARLYNYHADMPQGLETLMVN